MGAFRVNPGVRAGTGVGEVERDDDDDEQAGGDGQGGGPDSQQGGSEDAARGLVRALEAVTDAARRARERAEAKDQGQADEALARVAQRLGTVAQRLADVQGQSVVPEDIGRATERRLEQAGRRAEQARSAEKL